MNGEQVSEFVLVHGSWMGSWAWERVTPLLRQAGHQVTAIDLPGYGADTTPISEITLQAYIDRALAAIAAASGPVILVGHSMGGIVVSTAAEQWPERVACAVYVAAYMLPHGESVFSFSQGNPEFAASQVMGYLEIDEAGGTSRIRPDGVGPVFVNDGSPSDVAYATEHAHADYLAPSGTAIAISHARWGSVRRVYVETLRDQAVPVAAQQRMNELLPGADVHSIDSGHSPFLTQPRGLTDLLIHAAASTATPA
jgi:pimeloyl-ACP methyl ester carboxylesterase